MRWLGLIFAFFGGFASFGIGCATQVNAIATVCNENLHIPPAAIGIAVAVLTALVIFGGIKSIANVCERLVPFMAFFYVIGCIIILGINFDFIIPAVKTICKFAFTPWCCCRRSCRTWYHDGHAVWNRKRTFFQ